jgi:hypothetical protein
MKTGLEGGKMTVPGLKTTESGPGRREKSKTGLKSEETGLGGDQVL